MASGSRICTVCGSVSHGRMYTPGSLAIEIMLWLCFLIPGLIYSIWRQRSRHVICPTCESDAIIPLNTPKGREMAASVRNLAAVADDLPEGNATRGMFYMLLIAVAVITAIVVSCVP